MVVNSLSTYADNLVAEQHGRKYLYRTGAAFVSARLGITSIPPLTAKALNMDCRKGSRGGLIVAGSYVPKTTAQLKALRERRGDKLHVIELDVANLIESEEEADKTTKRATAEANDRIKNGEDVLVMTSRKLITGQDAISSLSIGSAVAAALVKVVQDIDVRPRYIIAKVFSLYDLFGGLLTDFKISGRYHFFRCSYEGVEHETSYDRWSSSTWCPSLDM